MRQEALSAPRTGSGRRASRPGTCTGPRAMCASYSCRNCLIVVSTGVAAASPKAHSVLPAMLSATLSSRSMSRIVPSPRSILSSILQQPVAALAARRALAARLRDGRSAAGSWPPTPCTSCRPSRSCRPIPAASRPSSGRRSWRRRRSDPAAGSAPTMPPGITAFSCRPFGDAAGVVVDQLTHGRVHRRFEDAGLGDVAADAEQLRAAVLLGPERREPLGAARDDRRARCRASRRCSRRSGSRRGLRRRETAA